MTPHSAGFNLLASIEKVEPIIILTSGSLHAHDDTKGKTWRKSNGRRAGREGDGGGQVA